LKLRRYPNRFGAKTLTLLIIGFSWLGKDDDNKVEIHRQGEIKSMLSHA
jgi:hypothetical protein